MGFGIADPEIAVRWRQAHADPIGPNRAADGIDDFDQEPCAVLNRSAIFIFAPIGPITQKRIHEKVIGAMYLDTIHTRLDRAFRGSREGINGPFYFREG